MTLNKHCWRKGVKKLGLLKTWRMVFSWQIWLARQEFITLCKTFSRLMCNRLPSLCSAAVFSAHYKHANPAIQHPLASLPFPQLTGVKHFHISHWQWPRPMGKLSSSLSFLLEYIVQMRFICAFLCCCFQGLLNFLKHFLTWSIFLTCS